MGLLFIFVLAGLCAGTSLACYDNNDNFQICTGHYYSGDSVIYTGETECCECSSGCCTPDENSLCDTAKSILSKLPTWAWVSIGVGGGVFLLILIIGCCCCCGCCSSGTRTITSYSEGTSGGMTVVASSSQAQMNSPVANGSYGYNRFV